MHLSVMAAAFAALTSGYLVSCYFEAHRRRKALLARRKQEGNHD